MRTLMMMVIGAFFVFSLTACFPGAGIISKVADKSGLTDKATSAIFSDEEEKEAEGETLPTSAPSNEEVKLNES